MPSSAASAPAASRKGGGHSAAEVMPGLGDARFRAADRDAEECRRRRMGGPERAHAICSGSKLASDSVMLEVGEVEAIDLLGPDILRHEVELALALDTPPRRLRQPRSRRGGRSRQAASAASMLSGPPSWILCAPRRSAAANTSRAASCGSRAFPSTIEWDEHVRAAAVSCAVRHLISTRRRCIRRSGRRKRAAFFSTRRRMH